MASIAFQPFVDKENAGSIGVRPNKGQAGGGLGLGKVFGKGNDLSQKRRALGDVGNKTSSNEPLRKLSGVPLQSKGLQMKCSNIQPLANQTSNIKKPTVNLSTKKKIGITSKETVKTEPVVTKKAPEIEDIEQMFLPTEEEDDFEDIWPKSERISTYIKKLVSWRPPCIFGELPDSEDEEHEEAERKRRNEELDRRLENSIAVYSIQSTEPSLEDLPELEPVECEEVPFPSFSLDNTLDLMPDIGPLQLVE